MKRSGLNRKARLKREIGLRRTKHLRASNPERRARLRERQFGPQAELCRTMRCLVCGSPPPSDPAHVNSRGAGGLDRANVVPLCRVHHVEQHAIGIKAFEEMHGLDLRDTAESLAGRAYPS